MALYVIVCVRYPCCDHRSITGAEATLMVPKKKVGADLKPTATTKLGQACCIEQRYDRRRDNSRAFAQCRSGIVTNSGQETRRGRQKFKFEGQIDLFSGGRQMVTKGWIGSRNSTTNRRSPPADRLRANSRKRTGCASGAMRRRICERQISGDSRVPQGGRQADRRSDVGCSLPVVRHA